MESDHKAVAEQLHEWFRCILRITDENLFSIVPEGPHRDAVVLNVLRRNARILTESAAEYPERYGRYQQGKLYSPLCFFLAAACRWLGTPLGAGHWRAALDNVVHLQQQLVSAREQSAAVGLEIGSPTELFTQQFYEAINQAALVGGISYLNKESRQVVLGLAINWAMRLLLAYALEYSRSENASTKRDLVWIGKLIEPLLTASSSAP